MTHVFWGVYVLDYFLASIPGVSAGCLQPHCDKTREFIVIVELYAAIMSYQVPEL